MDEGSAGPRPDGARRAFRCRGRGDGLLHVFLPHATAGVALMDRERLGTRSRRAPRADLPRRPVRAPARAGGPRRRPSAAGARVALARVAGDRGRLQLGVAIRRVDRPEPRERRQDRATQLVRADRTVDAQRYWPGVRSSRGRPIPPAHRVLGAGVLAVDLDLQARGGQEEHPVALLGDPDVGTDQRHVAPGQALARRRRIGGSPAPGALAHRSRARERRGGPRQADRRTARRLPGARLPRLRR